MKWCEFVERSSLLRKTNSSQHLPQLVFPALLRMTSIPVAFSVLEILGGPTLDFLSRSQTPPWSKIKKRGEKIKKRRTDVDQYSEIGRRSIVADRSSEGNDDISSGAS